MTLWQHQQNILKDIESKQYIGLAWDVGTGKTLAVLEIIKRLKFQTALILCPLSVTLSWREEFLKWGNKEVEVYHGKISKKKRKQILESEKIIIMNYESFITNEAYEALCGRKFQLLVIDESQRIKDPESIRTKKLLRIRDNFEFAIVMSGSMILNSLLDIWAQAQVMSNRTIFDKNFSVFRRRFFENRNASIPGRRMWGDWRPRPGSETEIKKLIANDISFVDKSEVLDLPPLIQVSRRVEMTPQQRIIYESMQKNLIAVFADKTSVAKIALEKLIRLQQISVGIFKDDTGKVSSIETDRPKILFDIMQDIPKQDKIIIWSNWVPTYDVIAEVCEKSGRSYGFLTGRQSMKDKEESILNFKNGDLNVLIANQASGGAGLNLQVAKYCIYYSRSFSLEHDIQSMGRIYRGGSEIHDKITRIDISTLDSVEDKIYNALINKRKIGELLAAIAVELTGEAPLWLMEDMPESLVDYLSEEMNER